MDYQIKDHIAKCVFGFLYALAIGFFIFVMIYMILTLNQKLMKEHPLLDAQIEELECPIS